MTIQELKQRCIDSLNAEPKDPSERELGYSIAMRHIIELLGTISQTEISDEEIEKASKYIQTTNPDLWTFKIAWKAGAKWYREQLKSKGNGEG